MAIQRGVVLAVLLVAFSVESARIPRSTHQGSGTHVATEDGLCPTLHAKTEHERFCDRYYQCVQIQDDSGLYLNVWIVRPCPVGTRSAPDGSCVNKQPGTSCNKVGNAVKRAVCTIGGDPHIRMFDGDCWLHFQGLCTYVLAAPATGRCNNLTSDLTDFTVESEHMSLYGNTKFAYLKNIHLVYKSTRFTLNPANSAYITLKGATKHYTSPGLKGYGVSFYRRSGELTATLSNGVSVSVRKPYEGKVRVPPSLQYCMQGFCGNFNGNCKDDFVTKSGQTLVYKRENSNKMGNSWKTDPKCADTTSPGLPQCNLPKWKKVCEDVLTSRTGSTFEKCSAVGTIYVKSCQTDICPHAGMPDQDEKVKTVICDNVRRAMSTECDRSELVLQNLPAYCKAINKCNSSSCQNGGSCVSKVNDYTCTCVAGYTGKDCETTINKCDSSPCQNGGSCVYKFNDYTCTCVAGYTGKDCGTTINKCDSSPCQNGGSCVYKFNDYTCTCVAGYTGKDCETTINKCDSSPCQNGGLCVYKVNDYTCTCVDGYTGKDCNVVGSKCGLNCGSNGTCELKEGNSVCVCDKWYAGNRCELNCNDEANCQNCVSSPECICEGCEFGAHSSVRYHPYKGVCNAYIQCVRIGTPGNYIITYTDRPCGPGTSWDQDILACNHNAVSDLTKCRTCTSTSCKNGGTCTDLYGTKDGKRVSVGFKCACAPGFTGFTCQTKTKVTSVANSKQAEGKAVSPKPTPATAAPCKRIHDCTKLGVKTCNVYEPTPTVSNSCSYYFYTQNSGVDTTNGAATFQQGSYLRSDSMVNIGTVWKLTVEVSIEIAKDGSAVQALVSDGDCQHESTFWVMLKRSSSEDTYRVQCYVRGANGKNLTVHSAVGALQTDTRYDIVFAYNARSQTLILLINGAGSPMSVPSAQSPGPVANGKGPFFIGRRDQHDCGSTRVQEYFKGKVFKYRVLAGDEIEDVPATKSVPTS